MLFRNVKGSSKNTCICGSWKGHWIKLSGKVWPPYCQRANCINKADVGAHITQVSGSQVQWIVPFCSTCNDESSNFYLKPGCARVRAVACR